MEAQDAEDPATVEAQDVGDVATTEMQNEVDVANVEHTFMSEIPMKEAMRGPDVEDWRRAIADEIKSVLKNETFKLVDRPRWGKVIGSRVVLRNKFKPNGELEKRKARLVAQGFSQQPGVHFSETFAPVARFSSIRLMASLAARHELRIKQFDIATACLNGILDEQIYMEPPKGFQETLRSIVDIEPDSFTDKKASDMLRELDAGDKVCLLGKALYGLRQAGRSWHKRLSETLKRIGATASASDPCLFHMGAGREITLIAIYVDDILIASKNTRKIAEIGDLLATEYEVKHLGDVKHCLGVEFRQTSGKVTMHQQGYVNDVLTRFGMAECKPVATPVDSGSKLIKNQVQSSEDLKLPYRELVGALTYLASTTRPEISFAVSRLEQFNNCFGKEHWTAAKRVLRYLKGTSDMGLSYGAAAGPIRPHVDADWGSCAMDKRSYTGFVFLLHGGPLSWNSRKQRTVALSTTEAEYMALSDCVKEALHWQRFVRELGFGESADLVVLCDNRSSLKLTENPVLRSRSKHIDIRHYFVRDALKEQRIKVDYVATESQVADFLTKGLLRSKHSWCAESSRFISAE